MDPNAITVTEVPGRMIKTDRLWRVIPWSEWHYRIRPLGLTSDFRGVSAAPQTGSLSPSQQGMWHDLDLRWPGTQTWGPVNTQNISNIACLIHGYGLWGEMSFSRMTSLFKSFMTQFLNSCGRNPVRSTVIVAPFHIARCIPKSFTLTH